MDSCSPCFLQPLYDFPNGLNMEMEVVDLGVHLPQLTQPKQLISGVQSAGRQLDSSLQTLSVKALAS